MTNTLKSFILFSLSFIFLKCDTPCPSNFEGKAFQKEVIAFYPYWKSAELPIKDIQWQYLTRIIFAFAQPEADGQLNTYPISNWSKELVKTAHKNGVEAYLSVGGGGGRSDHFTEMASQKATRERFVNEVAQYLEEFCFDGIDIDWEYLSYSKGAKMSRLEQKALVVLLHDLKKRLEPMGKEVSVDVYGSIWSGRFFLDEVAQYADQIHIMAYDFSGKWSEPMPHSSVEQAFGLNKSQPLSGIDYYLNHRKWDKTKLFLGIPFYGRDFNKKNVPGKPYKEIVGEYPDAPNRDDINNIYYNGQPTLKRKLALIQEYDLPGVMIWELTQDASDDNSLLKLIGEELNEVL